MKRAAELRGPASSNIASSNIDGGARPMTVTVVMWAVILGAALLVFIGAFAARN